MKQPEQLSRRKFIGSSALAGVAASFPYVARGEALQSDTVRIAAIGLGGRGSGAVSELLAAPADLEKEKGIKCNTKSAQIALWTLLIAILVLMKKMFVIIVEFSKTKLKKPGKQIFQIKKSLII